MHKHCVPVAIELLRCSEANAVRRARDENDAAHSFPTGGFAKSKRVQLLVDIEPTRGPSIFHVVRAHPYTCLGIEWARGPLDT